MRKPEYHRRASFWRALAALALLSTGGCASGDDPGADNLPSGGEASVVFGAYIGGAAESRASVINSTTLKKTGFGVFASHTPESEFDPDATGGSTPNFMYNQKVAWWEHNPGVTSAGEWYYEPEKVWPAGKVSFFAYAPYAASFGATGITAVTGPDTPGSPKLTFVSDNDVDRQIDLLCADADKTVNLGTNSQVQFRFRHVLARVGFSCAADATLDGNTTVTVTGVTLKLKSLGVSGTLNLRTGAWENIGEAEKEYTFGTDDFVAGGNVLTKALGTKASDLTGDGKYLMVIPTDKTVPVEVTVSYDIETVDKNLAAGSIKISYVQTSSFDLLFETGKAYRITLRLGMKTLGIDVGVSDWDHYESDWIPVEKSTTTVAGE